MYNLFLDRVQVYITTRTEIERRCEEYLKEIKVSNNLSNNSWNEFTQIVLIDLIHWFIDFCISLCLSLHLYLSTYICIYLSIYVSISSSFHHSLSLSIDISIYLSSLIPAISSMCCLPPSPHAYSSLFLFLLPLILSSLLLTFSMFPPLHFSHSLLLYLPSSSFLSFSSLLSSLLFIFLILFDLTFSFSVPFSLLLIFFPQVYATRSRKGDSEYANSSSKYRGEVNGHITSKCTNYY